MKNTIIMAMVVMGFIFLSGVISKADTPSLYGDNEKLIMVGIDNPVFFDDSIAVLFNRSYNNNQYAKGTLYLAGSDTEDEEVELHLQGSIAAHSIDTYELQW